MQSIWERDGSGGMSQRKVMSNTGKKLIGSNYLLLLSTEGFGMVH